MITKKILSKMNTNYDLAFNYLESKFIKKNKNYRVIDVGGNENSWAKDWVTHLADIQIDKNKLTKDVISFSVDIEDSEGWKPILDDVQNNGLFDFAICSHTLEDLNNPKITCKMLNNIARAGFISTPSKYAELCIFEYKSGLKYCGYHHHRWIYQIKNNKLIGTPKMNFHGRYCLDFDEAYGEHSEIAFLWEDNFEYEFICASELLDNRNGPNRFLDLFERDDLILR